MNRRQDIDAKILDILDKIADFIGDIVCEGTEHKPICQSNMTLGGKCVCDKEAAEKAFESICEDINSLRMSMSCGVAEGMAAGQYHNMGGFIYINDDRHESSCKRCGRKMYVDSGGVVSGPATTEHCTFDTYDPYAVEF
jgi:hypothetical protein